MASEKELILKSYINFRILSKSPIIYNIYDNSFMEYNFNDSSLLWTQLELNSDLNLETFNE